MIVRWQIYHKKIRWQNFGDKRPFSTSTSYYLLHIYNLYIISVLIILKKSIFSSTIENF